MIKTFFQSLRARCCFGGLLAMTGIAFIYLIFWGPLIQLQPPLAPGDMGRDLYAFWMTFRGFRPCQDFWWQYGPAPLFYFAFWFFAAGVHLMSVRLGLGVLLFLCSLCSYRALRPHVSRPLAFLASLAFLSLDVTYSTGHVRLRDIAYTFNHYVTFPFLLLALYFLWKFFLTRKIRWGYAAGLAAAAVALVKINTGLATFAALFVFLLGAGKKHIIFLLLTFGAAVFGAYGWFYRGLSFEEIDYCLTLKRIYHTQPYSFRDYFLHLIQWFIVWDRRRLIYLGAFFLLGLLAALGLRKGENPDADRRLFGFMTGSALLMGVANSLDYFVDGSIHRVDFWFFPVLVLLGGLWSEAAGRLFSPNMKKVLGVLFFFLLLWIPFQNLKEALAWRTPERYLDFPSGRVYVGGPPSFPRVLNEGVRFIIEHTEPDQKILVLPYDPLYLFLSGREQAVRELLFMEMMPLPEKREEEIIQELDSKKVPLIILSNRILSEEWGLGQFGKTFLTKLAPYLAAHYREAGSFGPWASQDYLNSHAIKVLERIS